MDWFLAAPQINSSFSSLGSTEGDSYKVNPNALAILEDINYKLTYEDQTLRTFRRAIGFSQNVRSDLIPLLENSKDYAVLDAVIRILVNLTIPVECLFSVDVMYRTEVGRLTIFELNKLLFSSKEAFMDPKSTKSVIEYMKHILESDSKLSPQKCDQINNCLLLLRNILHIPENNENFVVPSPQTNGSNTISMQNAILWNLFIQSIDKLLLYLMTSPQRAFWGVTIVQLIALIYKDQHVSTLQKLLNLWFEASLSESSEDNESNTSPPKQGSGDSSPMLTSDPTSDSSDTGSGVLNTEKSSEERRSVRREESTAATLLEVSRIGQVYQDNMDLMPAQSLDDENTNSTQFDIEGEMMPEYESQTDIMKGLLSKDDQDFPELLDLFVGPPSPIDFDEAGENNLSESQAAEENGFANVKHATAAENLFPKSIDDGFKPPSNYPVKLLYTPPLINIQEDEMLMGTRSLSGQHVGQMKLVKGRCCGQKRECPSSQSEMSDCGYGTQVENQESISTSSNDDDCPENRPLHQKPPCSSKQRTKLRVLMSPIEKKEYRRKKLVKRSKSSLINMKGLVQHTPTDEDISNLLKEFTVDFLLKGYSNLVKELHSQLLTNMKIPIDISHFFWLVTYFLKFAAQLELDIEHIDSILKYEVISYLTYEGVTLCEQLELNDGIEGTNIKPYLRRIHLVVTAIREFLQALETYKNVTHLSDDDKERLRILQIKISLTEDLRSLFVLLLRRFNPNLHSKQYLQDLVVTNHILLLILDGVDKTEPHLTFDIKEHISQFATLDIMHYYGLLLEDFETNGEFINDCVFTMMHHIGGDLGNVGALFQPVILRTYSRIWETNYQLCDDWSDLIEYVIHKFMKTPQQNTLSMPSMSLTELTKEYNSENTSCSWTQEEMDTLYWYYVQSKKTVDVIGKIVMLFSNNGNKEKSRISIIQQLLQQDIINLVEYDDLMKFEDAEYQRTLLTTPTSFTTESGIEAVSAGRAADDIQILRDLICKENKEYTLGWLQKILLECCHIKLTMKAMKLGNVSESPYCIMEPVAYHCILKNKSIPVVQWSAEHAAAMLYQPFILLLHKLGFQLPADAGSVFVRIPDYWTPEMMFSLATKMGTVDESLLKFKVSDLNDSDSSSQLVSSETPIESPTSVFLPSIRGCFESDLISEASEEISALVGAEELSEKKFEPMAESKIKPGPSTKRSTPDLVPMPAVPNWLQLVMNRKGPNKATDASPELKNDAEISKAAIAGFIKTDLTPPHPHQFAVPKSVPINSSNGSKLTYHWLSPSLANVMGLNRKGLPGSTNNNTMDHIKMLGSVGRGFTSTITTTATTTRPSVSSSTSGTFMRAPLTSSYLMGDRGLGFNPLGISNHLASEETYGDRDLETEYMAIVASVYENGIANHECTSVASDLTRMYVSDEEERHELPATGSP